MLLYITNQTKMLLGRGRKIKDLRRLKNHGSGRGAIKHLLSYFTGIGVGLLPLQNMYAMT
jgi:hypothetical protein